MRISTAKMIIARCGLSESEGITDVKTAVPATKPDATYTVKLMRKMMAHTTFSSELWLANLFVRYCGSVIESPDAFEKRRSLVATKIQLPAVPNARPMPIQTCPMPNAKSEPGKPIKSHPLMSDACALIAVTKGPI